MLRISQLLLGVSQCKISGSLASVSYAVQNVRFGSLESPAQVVSWGARADGALEASPAASHRSFSRQSSSSEGSARSHADSDAGWDEAPSPSHRKASRESPKWEPTAWLPRTGDPLRPSTVRRTNASVGRKSRNIRVQSGKEPDEMDQDMFDPTEFMLWLKEHFMKQDLGLSDGLKELIFKNHWDKVLVDVRRTVKVTKSAKLETFHAIACVGNFEGLFGVGIASSNNPQVVVGEAYVKAYQNLVPIPLYRGHTIYHRIDHKFHTIKMILMPRPEGYGVVSNPMLQEICTMIGLRDISIKVIGRRNQRNKFDVVKCLMEALQKQSTPHDGIEGSGVYAREVFYRPKLPFGLKRETSRE